MTRTDSPDNGHAHACYTTDVFLLDDTCPMNQRPEENADGHPKPATRYARTAPRRLLAARSKDPSAAALKTQAPRRQIKYRSLKRSQPPQEELAVRPQRRETITTRHLLAVKSRERTASERTGTTRRSLFMERDILKKTAENPLSREISELEVARKGSREIQPLSTNAAERRALANHDVSRKILTEMRTSRRTTERNISQKDASRRLALQRQSTAKLPAGLELNVHRRASTEGRSFLKFSTDHRLYKSDKTREPSGERQSERSVLGESRIRDLTVPRKTSAKVVSSRRMVAEHKMFEHGNSRRISSERQSSVRLTSDRTPEKLFRSRTSSDRDFSDTRLSRSPSTDIRQDESRNMRALSERAQISRLSTERFGSEWRSSSRVAQAEGRGSHAERSLSRRKSLNKAGNSERRYSTKRFTEKSINSEKVSAIRATARSMSSHIPPESHSSEQKQNEGQSSESVSRIKSGRQSVLIPGDKPSSRTLSDRTQGTRISNERLPQTSSNRLSLSRNSIDRIAVYRIADNRRVSAPAFEDRRNMRKRRSLSSESSDRRSSLRKSQERQFSYDRSSPLNSMVSTTISEERRASRASPTTVHLLTTSVARISANIAGRRLDQVVSLPISEFTTSRRMSNERVLVQSSKMRRTVPPGVSDKRLSAQTLAYRNNYVTVYTARQSRTRTSAERALVLRDSKIRNAENIIALSDSRRVSTRRLTSEKGYVKPVTGSRRFVGLLESARFSGKITDEKLTSEKDSRKSAEGLTSVRESIRISAETLRLSRSPRASAHETFSRKVSEKRLMAERDSKRYDKRLASVKNSRRVTAERLTSERQSRMSAEPLSSARDSIRITPDSRRHSESAIRFRDPKESSADRMPLEKEYRRSVERTRSVRNVRIILPGLKHPTDSSRTKERLSLLNNPRKNLFERPQTQRASKLIERLPLLRVSRDISRAPEHQIPSKRSEERLATLRHSRIYVGRSTTHRNSRPTEHFTTRRDSRRTSTERLFPRNFRSVEHLTTVRVSRSISTERLTSQRSAEQSRRFVTGTDSTRSSERINFIRDNRITGEPLAFTRATKSVSSERLSYKRNSRITSTMRTSRRTNGDFTSITRYSISPERTETRKNSKPSASERSVGRFESVRNSRASAERMESDRRSVDRLVSSRLYRRGYTEQLGSQINYERYVASLANNMNFLSISNERRVNDRSVGHLANLRNTRKLSTDYLSAVKNSKASAERLKSPRRFIRISNERQSVSKKYTPHHLATSRMMERVSTRTTSYERRVSQPEPLSTIRVTSKPTARRDVMRMSNVRNTRLAYAHISNTQALHQGFGLPAKHFSPMYNTTLKTESFFGIGLSLETNQKSVVDFTSAQYSNWSDKVAEYVKCLLATLTVRWPELTVWKGGVLASLVSFEGAPTLLSKMDHLNNFITVKVNCLHSYIVLFY